MNQPTKRGPGRPPRSELTDQQKRVLDLLAAGKTNGEIGDALGISLDGAKYHVREVCDRIGVDTREEAAEWWRQGRGLAARFAVVRGWSRLPVLLRWGIPIAGGLAAIVVVAAFVFGPGEDGGIGAGDEERVGLGEGLWVVVSVPVNEFAEGAVAVQRLELIGPAGQRRTLMEGGRYWQFSMSPDARRMVVADLADPERPVSHLVDLTSGDSTLLAQTTDFESIGNPVWTPDGQRFLAGVALDATSADLLEYAVITADGVVERRFPVGDLPTLQPFSYPASDLWAADGQRFAGFRPIDTEDGRKLHDVVVGDLSGNVIAETPASELTAVFDEALPEGYEPVQGLSTLIWADDSTLVFTTVELPENPPGRESDDTPDVWTATGRITGSTISWTVSPGGDLRYETTFSPDGPFPQWVIDAGIARGFGIVMDHFVGPELRGGLVWFNPDGGMAAAIVPEADISAMGTEVIVDHNGTPHRFAIDTDPRWMRSGGMWWDALVVD